MTRLTLSLIVIVVGTSLFQCTPLDPGEANPIEVPPADNPTQPADPGRDGPGPGAEVGSAIWVVDADDVPVGVLVARGSDDKASASSVYDRARLFHPASGLFFEVSMSDGAVRYPTKVYFKGSGCTDPVGVALGSCQECRSGPGTAIRHDGVWFQVVAAKLWEVLPNAASIDSGIASTCVAHGSTSTKGFPLAAVDGATPASEFKAPLRYDWR